MENCILYSDGHLIYQKLTANYVEEACTVIVKTLFLEDIEPSNAECMRELALLPKAVAKDGLTVIAVDKIENKVVGVAFNKLQVKDEKFFENFIDVFVTEEANKVLDFVLKDKDVCNIFEHCKIDCCMDILFLGTLPEFRKQGIAKKLWQLSVDAAQNLVNGFNVKHPIDNKSLDLEPLPKAVMSTLVSFISQRIGLESGFTVAMEHRNEAISGEAIASTPSMMIAYKMLYKQ